jgi:hypothetical protein
MWVEYHCIPKPMTAPAMPASRTTKPRLVGFRASASSSASTGNGV